MEFAHEVEIVLLLASPIHRYEGRPSDGPLTARGQESFESIEVRAGLGVVGDRFFGHRAHREASVTLFAAESLDFVASALDVNAIRPELVRRNIVLRGIDVDALVKTPFSISSGEETVHFQGHRPANPCAWMDEVIAPGAMKALRKRGGVRCEPLSSGTLRLGPAIVRSALDLSRAASVALF